MVSLKYKHFWLGTQKSKRKEGYVAFNFHDRERNSFYVCEGTCEHYTTVTSVIFIKLHQNAIKAYLLITNICEYVLLRKKKLHYYRMDAIDYELNNPLFANYFK